MSSFETRKVLYTKVSNSCTSKNKTLSIYKEIIALPSSSHPLSDAILLPFLPSITVLDLEYSLEEVLFELIMRDDHFLLKYSEFSLLEFQHILTVPSCYTCFTAETIMYINVAGSSL